MATINGTSREPQGPIAIAANPGETVQFLMGEQLKWTWNAFSLRWLLVGGPQRDNVPTNHEQTICRHGYVATAGSCRKRWWLARHSHRRDGDGGCRFSSRWRFGV